MENPLPSHRGTQQPQIPVPRPPTSAATPSTPGLAGALPRRKSTWRPPQPRVYLLRWPQPDKQGIIRKPKAQRTLPVSDWPADWPGDHHEPGSDDCHATISARFRGPGSIGNRRLDFDGDGSIDLAFTMPGMNIVVLRGDGTGAFTQALGRFGPPTKTKCAPPCSCK